jgi:hypothetical protein
MPVWLEWIIDHVLGIPVKIVQALVKIIPTRDHFRFNIVADLLSLTSVVLLSKIVAVPKPHRVWWLLSIPFLFVFFAWCFKTALVTRRR